MLVKDVEFTLKDGRKAVLRSPREEDAPELLECFRTVTAETDFIIRYPEESAQLTVEGEKEMIGRLNASELNAMLICLVDGRIAGNCQISFHSAIKTGHRAGVAIGLLKEFWSQGIGARMFQEMIRLAEEHGGVTQLELEFIEGNSRARGLYEKMGFRIAGVHPNAIRLRDGTLLNNYLMIRELPEPCR